jgi:hypothetical protein
MGKVAYSEAARQRLLDAWSGKTEFGDPIGCVTTTFTFEAAFFEEQCLSRFLKIENDPAEDIRGYLVEREERLSQAAAFVFVDDIHVPRLRSLRWHVLPMRVPRGGVFHAKVTLLIWEKHARVLVTSANMTEFGYRRNYEQMAVLEFGPEGDVPIAPLRQILNFIRTARALSPGLEKKVGPQAALGRFLDQVDSQIARWPAGEWRKGEPKCSLLVVRPGTRDTFAQLADLWSGPPADVSWVLSPFYSSADDARKAITGLESLLLRRGDRRIKFIGRGWREADQTVVLEMPASMREPSASAMAHEFAFVPQLGQGDRTSEVRDLHAKSLWIQRAPRALFVVGSSNFTAPGLGLGPVTNVEANIVYEINDVSSRFGKIAGEAYPPIDDVDLDGQKVRFRDDAAERTPEPEPYAALPDAFGSALFRQTDGRTVIDLEILSKPPERFSVLTPGDVAITGDAEWKAQGSPDTLELTWPDPRPPTFLLVEWPGPEHSLRAVWVINVADLSALPPPDELRELPLEDLLELLTSARPYHEVLNQIWRRRQNQKPREGAVVVDPHRRVDTRGFVIQRMRRIAAALEGMKERLERPVFTIDALRWRLHGPVGPLALAKRLAAEEQEGAAFMIAEVALTVHDAQLNAPGALGAVDAAREKRLLLDHLKELAVERGAPANMQAYVQRTFAELTS